VEAIKDKVQQLISFYNLLPHPEGGFYRQTYKSSMLIDGQFLSNDFEGSRAASTAIYFLLNETNFSSFHRIKSDELWHFYAGDALNIYVIDVDGNFEIIKLGNNYINGESFQAVVKAGSWFASAPNDNESFSFVGCTVAPGFDFLDFELAERDNLIGLFPQHKNLITSFTRI
jgi:predicted cupin superfamily sugar epimerase